MKTERQSVFDKFKTDEFILLSSDDELPDLECTVKVEPGIHVKEEKIDDDDDYQYLRNVSLQSDDSITDSKGEKHEKRPRKVRGRTKNKEVIDLDHSCAQHDSAVIVKECEDSGRLVGRRNLDELCIVQGQPCASMVQYPLQDGVDLQRSVRVTQFTEALINIIQACFEEVDYNQLYAAQAAEFLLDYTQQQQEPTTVLLRDLLFRILPRCKHPCRVYNVLRQLLHMFIPGDVPFSWKDIEGVVAGLRLPFGQMNLDPHQLQVNTLSLAYMVQVMHDELRNRSLYSQRQIQKSFVYKTFGHDFNKVSLIISWIQQTLYFNEYEEITSSFLKLELEDSSAGSASAEDQSKDCPKVLPLLMHLLEMIIMVDRDTEGITKRIAGELVAVYLSATSLFQRHLLLTLVVSPALRFRILQRVIEDHCPNSECIGSSSQIRLRDVIL